MHLNTILTFYGRLVLTKEGDEISIDSRPSDCISIAVRVKCPIYIDEGVVDEAGISVDVVNQKPLPAAPQPESELNNLKHLLDIAVAEENYEEAAKLRDKIKELEEKL